MADRRETYCIARRTRSSISGVRTVLVLPSFFFFFLAVDPVCLRLFAHNRIALSDGRDWLRGISEWRRKTRRVCIRPGRFWQYALAARPSCSPVQRSVAAKYQAAMITTGSKLSSSPLHRLTSFYVHFKSSGFAAGPFIDSLFTRRCLFRWPPKTFVQLYSRRYNILAY